MSQGGILREQPLRVFDKELIAISSDVLQHSLVSSKERREGGRIETEMNPEMIVVLSLLCFQGKVVAEDWGLTGIASVGLETDPPENSSESSVSADSAGGLTENTFLSSTTKLMAIELTAEQATTVRTVKHIDDQEENGNSERETSTIKTATTTTATMTTPTPTPTPTSTSTPTSTPTPTPTPTPATTSPPPTTTTTIPTAATTSPPTTTPTTIMEKTTAVGENDEVEGGFQLGSLEVLGPLVAIVLVLFASIALVWVLCKRSVLRIRIREDGNLEVVILHQEESSEACCDSVAREQGEMLSSLLAQ